MSIKLTYSVSTKHLVFTVCRHYNRIFPVCTLAKVINIFIVQCLATCADAIDYRFITHSLLMFILFYLFNELTIAANIRDNKTIL